MHEHNTAPVAAESGAQESRTIRRGDILWFYPIYYGMKEAKPRPCVVVSNDIYNTFSGRYTIVPMTSQPKKISPTHVAMYQQSYFGSTVCCEALQTICAEQITQLTSDRVLPDIMRLIDLALAKQLGLPMVVGIMQ